MLFTRRNVTNTVTNIISGLDGGMEELDICYAIVKCTVLSEFQSGNSGEEVEEMEDLLVVPKVILKLPPPPPPKKKIL